MAQGVVPIWRAALAGLVLGSVLGACTRTPDAAWDPSAGTPRPERVSLRVQGEAQRRNLSCESRSAVDLLGHHGISMREADFLAALPRSDNPDLGFVGSVDGPTGQLPPHGYGVHAAPVAALLRQQGLDAEAGRGWTLDALRQEIAQGHPVLVWATSTLDAPVPVRGVDSGGRAFTAVRGEHTWLAVGYAPGRIELLDSATGRMRSVQVDRFDASWATLGRMAIRARRPAVAD